MDQSQNGFTVGMILFNIDFDDNFIVKTDAYYLIVARIMSLYDNTIKSCPAAYILTKMSFTDCDYKTYDKELLAIIYPFEI